MNELMKSNRTSRAIRKKHRKSSPRSFASA